MADDLSDPLRRLQVLKRDLAALADSRLPNIDRLSIQLDASTQDLRRLLERNKRKDSSRQALRSNTINIDDVEYQITDQFRQGAIQVADELELDEIEAAKLCLEVLDSDDGRQDSDALCMRAVVRFHYRRETLLDCLRMILRLGNDPDSEEEHAEAFRAAARELIQGPRGGQNECSAYWNKCLDGLVDIEHYLKKVADTKDKLSVVGRGISIEENDCLVTQRFFLTRQHESLAAVLSYLISGDFVQPQDFTRFVNHASSLESAFDITIHYLPVLCTGASKFASEHMTDAAAVGELHRLFTESQHQWKQPAFKAAATVCWLAEYNARFANGYIDPGQAQAERQRDDAARSELFFATLRNKAFHFILAAAAALKPVVWHDPARTSIISHLTDSALVMSSDAPRPSDEFSAFTMSELRMFTEALVENMHENLRSLREDEEHRRRVLFSSIDVSPQNDLEMERFMAIMACTYQDDPSAAEHFWSDRGGNLYGFLRWVSSRLTTPGVSACCLLLRSMASDEKSANNVHRFLLEDTTMVSGKLRKSSGVSWSLIFKELELYASSVKEQVSVPAQASSQARASGELLYEGEDTSIMLDAYLGLTAWICRRSSEARNFLLNPQQTFHIGDTMFQLARTAHTTRLQACCLDVLSALLTNMTLEVRNGVWASLDTWISSGGLDGSSAPRALGRTQYSAKHYLQLYANSADSAASMVGLLNMLVTPIRTSQDFSIDPLPFPETLGAPHRHAGIDAYVDFVLGGVFARKLIEMQQNWEINLTNVVRYECLRFALACLSSFDEDLILLANTTSVSVESAIETKSLAAYARLHPFARVMEWLFNRDVLESLFATLYQNTDALDTAEIGSPLVQGTLLSLRVLDLGWKLQPTYFDIVRPSIASQATKSPPVSPSWPSLDEALLTHLSAISVLAQLTASQHVELSFASISLLRRVCSSRKISLTTITNEYGAQQNRILSLLAPLAAPLTLQLSESFILYDWDLECGDIPVKVSKADAVLHLLNASLDASEGRPCVAHCLLGFQCRERGVEVHTQSPFNHAKSLFHSIVTCAATSPVISVSSGYTSWLLSLKRQCLGVILKLAVSPLTAHLVQPELKHMEFLAALSLHMMSASASTHWDNMPLQDDILYHSSAAALRDFMRVREAYFQLYAIHLRAAANTGSYSIREKIISALLGTIQHPTGEQQSTISVFDLVDFFDLGLPVLPADLQTTYFDGIGPISCEKDDSEPGETLDVALSQKLLVLRKRELKEKGVIKDSAEEEAADQELQWTVIVWKGKNSLATIHTARLGALEAWTELLSLVITRGGLSQGDIVGLALQGLLVVLPKFEKALAEEFLDAVAFLAKLTLTFTYAISPASHDSSEQTANVAIERLLAVFRVSLKVITSSDSDLGLRDVSYRTCCAVLASVPKARKNGRATPAASARQLFQLVQSAGERAFAVVTEDSFSDRGVTRVSALLFLDSLIALFQSLKVNTALIRSLVKLNFVPVLIDSTIGHVARAFSGEDEMVTTLSYFHTALALMLRLCQTTDGAQLVLNSGLFAAIDDSKLFATDPDIGLDIDNPKALEKFYAILADMLRVITAAVVQKGVQPGRDFLARNRFTIQAIFKQASRGHALDVADELGKLMLATGYLEDDQAAVGGVMTNGFS
ncbi:nuclear pore complex subunit Nup192 like [Lecanosticta acicola]|uniref:Nuclear pore complex subunit Nup192 like n=1 Tax=Lecanosticta acicola TaxID=111012 RepID=A0AAI8YTN8_9PEZI|nr:nuclear pore complex subunit Nup192 like [Lecanosticta acicola]